MEESRSTPKSHGFPCGSCGNRMVFAPDRQALACPYCGSTEEIDAPAVEAAEHLYDPASETASAPIWDAEGELVHVCPSCGAETVTEAESMTVTCPFCGGHYVTEPQTAKPILRPETMIPHKLTRERAGELFAKWARRRYFAPRAFRRAALKPEMQGVYLPYFTYDSDLATAFSGQGGRRRTVTYTVRVNGKTQMRTKTVIDWYPVSGSREMYLDDTPLCASQSIDERMLAKLGPFSTKVLNVYHPAYLAGFVAERYTVGLADGFARVRPQMEGRMEDAIKSSLGYDTYRGMSYRHDHRRITFKHILLPVWLSSYTFAGKVYRFMVNGESGRVAGKSPVSPLKVALAVLAGVGLAALLFWLIVMLGDSASALLGTPADLTNALPPT